MTKSDDLRWMARAVELARSLGDRPFASVLVDMDRRSELTVGMNHVEDGPIWHGEMDALSRGEELQVDWKRTCLYTTAEPCCMCIGGILWAGIPRVVFGTSIDLLVERNFRQVRISAREIVNAWTGPRCQVVGGVATDLTDPLFDRR